MRIISELDNSEKKWWKAQIKDFRSKSISSPAEHTSNWMKDMKYSKLEIESDFDNFIYQSRVNIYNSYLLQEADFHKEILNFLSESRDLPKTILEEIIAENMISNSINDQNTVKDISRIVGEYTGRIFPYIYELCLSSSNSRRARAGQTFEQIIEKIFDIFEIPYNTQAEISASKHNLGKKVDCIIPSVKSYEEMRQKCGIVTMKTTLRERWQEVAEELTRTNVPSIFLLTIDENITEETVKTMSEYNIILVLYGSSKRNKFSNYKNVMEFSKFFLEEVPSIVSWWAKNEN